MLIYYLRAIAYSNYLKYAVLAIMYVISYRMSNRVYLLARHADVSKSYGKALAIRIDLKCLVMS